MNTRECRRLLERAFGSSVHCYRKGRAILHSIFAYGVRQEWCDTNPVSRIEVPPVEETTVEPLSPEAADRLLQAAHLRRHRPMRFSLYLMLYCGLRPAEVQRLRPERDVLWDERQVVVRPVVSKTGGGRVVPLRGISALPPQERHIPRGWQQRWLALRRAAGFTHWVPDVCRHTFASYYATHYKDLATLQLEMGHRDAGLLRTRYITPARRKQAAEFWRRAR
jgi:integrase